MTDAHIWNQLSSACKKNRRRRKKKDWVIPARWWQSSQAAPIGWKSELELYKSISSLNSTCSNSFVQQICLTLKTCQRNEWGWRLLTECWGLYFQHGTMHHNHRGRLENESSCFKCVPVGYCSLLITENTANSWAWAFYRCGPPKATAWPRTSF